MPRIVLEPEPGRPDAFTLRVDGADQSHVDLADPTRLEFDYVRRMADVVDAAYAPPERRRVVHVGGAGLTLARWVARTRPTSAQVVLEPDVELTAYVREHLPLPPRSGIKVRPVTGEDGLPALRDAYADVVVLDAYAGARVPAGLTTREWFAEAARVLDCGGLLLANVADSAPFDHARRVVAGVRCAFGHVVVAAEPATLRGRRFGNLLVVASDAPVPTAAVRRAAASSPFPYRLLEDDDVERRLGGARPFTVADAAPSPAPPHGATAFG